MIYCAIVTVALVAYVGWSRVYIAKLKDEIASLKK